MDKFTVSRSRLGRGLSSLLTSTDTSDEPAGHTVVHREISPSEKSASDATPQPFRMIKLSDIRVNPHQPRKVFAEESIAGLAASIKTNGLIQPIIVRAVEGGYELIAGERRLRAATHAGLADIPAIVRDVDSFAQAQMAIVENIQRENLNPIDRAAAYATLLQRLGLTQAELALRLGESRATVANHARLLELPDSVQTMVRDGSLSLGHAKVLAGVSDVERLTHLANLCVSQDLSVRALEAHIEKAAADPIEPQAPRPAPSAHMKEIEATLTRALGLRVQMRKSGKSKGRLVIHYASLDQFDELMKRLDVQLASD